MNRTEPKHEHDNRIDNRLTPDLKKPNQAKSPAGWRRGYAPDCKSVKTGSIPVPASIIFNDLRRVEASSVESLKQTLKLSRSGLVQVCTVPAS